MRHAFEAAQRRADDRAQRLEAHIERRLQERSPRPERAAVALLRTLDPGEVAAIVLENLPRAISERANWWRTCEILAAALKFADGLEVEPRLRIGNLALNFATDALPDLYQIDYEADHAPRVTPGAEHRLLAARPATVLRAHEPVTEPPRAWNHPQVDGHFFVGAVHSETREAVRTAFEDGSIERAARAVSALQSVPLMINPEVLDCLKHYDEFGGCGIKHIPPKDSPSHRNAWWQRQLQGRYRALRVRFDRTIDTATRLLGQSIYVRLRCDYRGRIAPITDLHFGREDAIRGLLMFARPKPIGEDGLRRLKIQVATCGGFDGINRASEDERAQWCDNPINLAMVRMIARLPKWRLSQRWLREAKDPIQFLAACKELIAALEAGPTFQSRLPCTIDATASGYQHLTLMRGATQEAVLVNLVPDMPPQDFYGRVAEEVRALLERDQNLESERRVVALSESEFNILTQRTSVSRDDLETRLRLYEEDDPPDEAAERGLFADWALSELAITRDLVKSNTMTKVYGADERGSMTNKNFEHLENLMSAELLATSWLRLRWDWVGKYTWDKYRRRAQRLARYVDEVIQKLMPRVYETMERLQQLAVALGREEKFVSWQTPSGFPFRNCYRNPVKERPRFIIGDEPRQKVVSVGWGGPRLGGQHSVKSGVVANVVHACDASHLMLTVNAANRAGISDIVSVHDSLGCHAADVERFRCIILDQLMQMHEQHDVLGEIWNAARAATDAPLPAQLEREAFNWRGLLKAKHAFS
jgi:DNA-directed RNA polymerase